MDLQLTFETKTFTLEQKNKKGQVALKNLFGGITFNGIDQEKITFDNYLYPLVIKTVKEKKLLLEEV
tara:strand:+ start:212 stop:412 length:201 start_codon:yes stop_codon:yes gene_type:complete